MILEATVDGRQVRVDVQGKGGRYLVRFEDRCLEVDFAETSSLFASLLIDGRSHEVGLERRPDGYNVLFPEDTIAVRLQAAARGDAGAARHAASGPASVLAPMPGKIVRLLAGPGDEVSAGQGLVVMEAMKMENELRAPRAGRVRETRVAEGQAVEGGALLVLLD
jgi:biotin carboxyl carrier protein